MCLLHTIVHQTVSKQITHSTPNHRAHILCYYHNGDILRGSFLGFRCLSPSLSPLTIASRVTAAVLNALTVKAVLPSAEARIASRRGCNREDRWESKDYERYESHGEKYNG